jgi:hypothetical protein
VASGEAAVVLASHAAAHSTPRPRAAPGNHSRPSRKGTSATTLKIAHPIMNAASREVSCGLISRPTSHAAVT